jgi:UDP-glucose 4-epimerase
MSKGKVLVTGGTGYIGSHTIIDLISKGYTPISIDNGVNSDNSILERVEAICGQKIINYSEDVCDLPTLENIFQEHQFVGIIHFAALKAVGDSVKMPIEYFRNNINSTINLLDLALKYSVPGFIFSSSCTVYGDAVLIPVTEETPWQEATSPYGRSKQIGEQMIVDCLRDKKTQAVILRYFNPCGAHHSGKLGEAPSNVAQNLVPVITETAFGKRDSMMVFGDDYDTRDGSCVRDYIHIEDLATAHTQALDSLLAGQQSSPIEVYNLGIGQGVTVLEAVYAFEKVTGQKLNYVIGPRRQGDVIKIYADCSKATQKLGWKPKYDIEAIMKTAWTWELERNK